MDLDGDGRLDMLSGSWPGELFLFRGAEGGGFAASVMLEDKAGVPINIGGGIQEDDEQKLLIAGTVEIEEQGDRKLVRFQGRELALPKERAVWTTGTASAVFAADWDADGDLDLLVGDIYGSVHLLRNEAASGLPVFAAAEPLEAGGKDLKVAGDAGPHVADWDGDGDLDLLVGDGEGRVSLFRNQGSRSQPELSGTEILVEPGHAEWGDEAPAAPTRGIRAKVATADWNGDGRLDLLVGDFATLKPDRPPLSAAEEAEQAHLRKERDQARAEYQRLDDLLDERRQKLDPDEAKSLETRIEAALEHLMEIDARVLPEYENHGWIWLFPRRAPLASAEPAAR